MDVGLERAAKIARANDLFRNCGRGFVLTPGVHELEDWCGLIEAVRVFDSFTEDNDPYGEHDFGSLEWHGEKVFWKINYYDKNLEYGLDPLDKDCSRVMTVMLAIEY